MEKFRRELNSQPLQFFATLAVIKCKFSLIFCFIPSQLFLRHCAAVDNERLNF